MSPIADKEHMELFGSLFLGLHATIDPSRVQLFVPGVNISDQPVKWTKNDRVPNIALFLKGNPAQSRETDWFGGPDLAVEILSPKDRSRKKFDFYAKVGVPELLLVDRAPLAA